MSIKELSHQIDFGFQNLTDNYSMILLRWSIGLIYIWFGFLKFFPGYSPAESLATNTLDIITFHIVNPQILLWGLAIWELLIGVFLIMKMKSKLVIWVLLVHMGGTLSPIFFFPELVFSHPPFGFSMVGQYIMKNLVIISAALVLYKKN